DGNGEDTICSSEGRKKRGFVRDGSVWRSSVHYQGQLYGRRKNCSVHSYKKEEALNGSSAVSSARTAVTFSSARTTKRFPSNRKTGGNLASPVCNGSAEAAAQN